MAKDTSNELLSLMNIGTATYKDLQLLEVSSIHQLADACADELYMRWWEWTKIRKFVKRGN
jgi:hypothetical protein